MTALVLFISDRHDDCDVYDKYRVEVLVTIVFFQAEDGIRDLVRSRGLGDVYKRQVPVQQAAAQLVLLEAPDAVEAPAQILQRIAQMGHFPIEQGADCLLYTSDAADERSSVDLGGRRIIKKKKKGVNCSHEVCR